MKPLLLHYYITNRCNARCQFCDIWKEQPKTDAITEEVLSNLFHARKAGCSFVDFTGGEPLLHQDLPLFLRKARQLGFITSVTTNTLLFPDRVSELAGLIDLLHFSIDADTPAMNDHIHGRATFDSVLKSIPLALANNLAPDLIFTYSDTNIDSFSGIYAIAKKNRLMIILDPFFNTRGMDTVSRETHIKALKYSRLSGVYLNSSHLLLRNNGGNHREKPLCRAVSAALVILPDNRIALPCYHHKSDFIAINASLRDSFYAPARRAAIKMQGAYPFCEGCHINCYFDPSYTFLRTRYFLLSMKAKLFYAIRKYLIYRYPIPFPRRFRG